MAIRPPTSTHTERYACHVCTHVQTSGTETAAACQKHACVQQAVQPSICSVAARCRPRLLLCVFPGHISHDHGCSSYARRQADPRSGILRRRSDGTRRRRSQPRAANFVKDAVASLHVSSRGRAVPSGTDCFSGRMGPAGVLTIHPQRSCRSLLESLCGSRK